MTRALTQSEIAGLPLVPVRFPKDGSPTFPFSYSSHLLYRPDELRCEDGGGTERTNLFRHGLLAVYWIEGEEPVPYVFRTMDGSVRSMDAGCLGMLQRPNPPDVEFLLDIEGYIAAVVPSPHMVSAFGPLRSILIRRYAADAR